MMADPDAYVWQIRNKMRLRKAMFSPRGSEIVEIKNSGLLE